MTWSDFFLICFTVGLTFSIISLLAGSIHLHWPHFHIHVGGGHAPISPKLGGRGMGPVNIGTVAAFLAWFGGAGYLLAHYYSVWIVIAVGVAIVSGFTGASIVFFFLARVLIQKDEVLDPADYDMVGVLGKVSSIIRPSGTGEMIFSQAGSRRAAPARSEDGLAIPKGAEVVVTRYDRGIAYVRLWEELAKSAAQDRENI
jgi:membrane protein implicated in regulation of membrane protease activity